MQNIHKLADRTTDFLTVTQPALRSMPQPASIETECEFGSVFTQESTKLMSNRYKNTWF